MSNLSELLPSGGGQNVVEFTADGAISSGKPVILNSDGTVTEVAETSISESVGTPVVFEAAASTWTSASYDSTNNKIIIAYQDIANSNYGTAVVGTVSGTSISFGTPVVFESGYTQYTGSTFDAANGKVVIGYADATNSGYGTAIVGTVSGTSISFGSAVVFESANIGDLSAAYDSNSGKVVISYFDSGNSSYGTAIVGTVSGTSISFGSPVVFNSASSNFNFVTYDSNAQKVVIAYRDVGNSNYGTAIVGTVSGTSISFGSESVFNSNLSTDISSAYDANAQKVVVAYRDYGNSSYGTAIVGTVSGTSISFGSSTVFNTGTSDNMTVVYDANAVKTVIAYTDTSNSSYGTLVVGTVSGASISFGSETVFEAATATNLSSAYDVSAAKVVISYRDATNSEHGTAVVFQNASTETNLTATNFIGLASAAISDTASGDINVKGGINEAQTGLTIGSDYYVQSDGSLASDFIPFDISGAAFIDSFSIASQESFATGIGFNADGTKMFIVGFGGDAVYEYNLSTGFDVSTASYSQNFSVASQDTSPRGIAFNNNGTKMFVVGDVGKDVNEYTLSTGFDVSTASYSQNFSVNAQETGPTDVEFNSDGTKMFIVGRDGDEVNEYTLGTGFDVSTASYSQTFDISSQETVALGIAFNTSGTKMFIVGQTGDDVNEYSTTAASTTVKAGRAISATTINMMDLT